MMGSPCELLDYATLDGGAEVITYRLATGQQRQDRCAAYRDNHALFSAIIRTWREESDHGGSSPAEVTEEHEWETTGTVDTGHEIPVPQWACARCDTRVWSSTRPERDPNIPGCRTSGAR